MPWKGQLVLPEMKESRICKCILGKFCTHFIFALLALSPEGKFKTGLIDHEGKLESGDTQNWAKQSQISIGRK